MSTSRSRTAPSLAATSRRRLRCRRVRSGRYPSPKTRQAARIRRVATRIPWSSSGSVPSRVPGSRAIIRARWKRSTLRPASATLSLGRTPGRLADDETLAVARRRGFGGGVGRSFGRVLRRLVRPLGAVPGSRRLPLRGGGPCRATVPAFGAPLDAGGILDCRALGLDGPDGVRGSRLGTGAGGRRLCGRAAIVGRGRGQRRIEFRPAGRDQARVGFEDRPQLHEARLDAGRQLRLELREAVDDPPTRDDIDLVQAQLGGRVGRLEPALPAELAHGHELDQGGVAAQLEDERPGRGRRPGVRLGGPVGRPLEFLAPHQRAVGHGCRRFHRDDGPAPGVPDLHFNLIYFNLFNLI